MNLTSITLPTLFPYGHKTSDPSRFLLLTPYTALGRPTPVLRLQHHWKESRECSPAQDTLPGSRLMYTHLPVSKGSLTDLQLNISNRKLSPSPKPASF